MIKKVFVAFAASVLSVLLFSTAISRSFSANVDAPHLKRWLSSSHMYTHIVPATLEQAKDDTTINTDSTSVPLTDPGVQTAVNKAFSPTLLENSTNTAIDSVFRWLNGQDAKPDFKIDFTSAKQALATNLADYIKSRYATLPACAKGQLPNSSDVFAINCRPAVGFDINTAATNATKDIATSKDFLANPVITENNFNVSSSTENPTSNQKPLSDKYREIPKKYQTIKRAPLIGGLLAVLLGVFIFFMSTTKRLGLRHLGILLLTVGVVLTAIVIVFRLVLGRAENKVFANKKPSAQLTLQKDMFSIAKQASHDVTAQTELFGITYIVMGGVMLTYLIATRQKKIKQTAVTK